MKERHEFFVKSSDGASSYSVEIFVSDFDVVVHCSCPAGAKRKLCKHKVRLMDNDVDLLVHKQQHEALNLVLRSLHEASVLVELQRYKEAELVSNAAAVAFDQAKKRLEKIFQGTKL